MKSLAISLIGFFALASGAQAQTPVISLICGGIGLEESQPMRSAQSDHALTILFSTQSGSYVAGVKTRVEDPLADVAATHDNCGPVASVDVNMAGRYRVTGELDGVKREQWVDLRPSGGGRSVLRWPD